MRVKVNAKDLVSLLNRSKPALPTTPVIPVTRMIKLVATDRLEAIAADGHGFFLGAFCDAHVESPGEVLVEPALLQIAEAAKDRELELETRKTRLYVSGYGDADLSTMDAKDFPLAPTVEQESSISFTKKEIAALGLSAATAGGAEHLPQYLGVNIIHESGVTYCTTTVGGFWFTVVTLDEEAPDALVPFKYLAKAIKATNESRLGLGGNHAIVRGEAGWSVFSLYTNIPTRIAPRMVALESEVEVVPDHRELLDALKLCVRFSEKSSIVTLNLTEDGLHIESGGNEYGNYERNVSCSSSGGREVQTKCNSSRLYAMLKDAGPGAQLGFCPSHEGLYSIKIENENIYYLLSAMH